MAVPVLRLDFDVLIRATGVLDRALVARASPADAVDAVLPDVYQDMPPAPAPTMLRVWLDPFWEGVWVRAAVHQPPGCPWGAFSLFRVRAALRPLPHGSMEQAATPAPLLQAGERTLVDGLKLQFFTQRRGARRLHRRGVAVPPDFRFAAALPLHALPHPPACVHLGVWNGDMNPCMFYGTPLPSWLLTVAAHAPPAPPEAVRLLCLPSPDAAHHARVMTLRGWIKATWARLYPGWTSCFTNPHTFLRDPWTAFLLQDVHALFDAPLTSLPPTLACYALANALVVAGVRLDSFGPLLRRATQAGGEPAGRRVLLRVARDVLMCQTLCALEGAYRADEVLGAPTDDQPFSFSFRPPGAPKSGAVFDVDDCEGRAEQGCVHMRALLVAMAADRRDSAFRFTTDHLRAHAAATVLRVDAAALALLAGGCADLGDALASGALQTHMCVGDCTFGASFRLPGRRQKAPEAARREQEELGGHCYGLLLLPAGPDAVVMETTGWTVQSDGEPDAVSDAWSGRAYDAAEAEPYSVMPRCPTTDADVARMYRRTLSGNSCYFFTPRPRPAYPDIGAGAPALVDGSALRMDMRDILRAMDPATPPGPWPKQEGAGDMAALYARVREDLPYFARVLRPPPEGEPALLHAMGALFGPITQRDLDLAGALPPATVAFSYRADRPPPPVVADLLAAPRLATTQHRFMQSVVVLSRVRGGAAP